MPYIGGAANGLFAEHGLDVEIVEPAPGPANVERVASGDIDFCLTSVSHYLNAQRRQMLPARFVAAVVRRSPMAAFVRADSDLHTRADLGGRALGGPAGSELVAQYQAAVAFWGLAPSALVPTSYGDAPAALGRGEVDIVADYIDLLPRTRRQAGVALRVIPVGPDVYSSGLVAGDSLSFDLVACMRGAIVDALIRQRARPDSGLEALCRRYPEVDPCDALEGWSLVEPNIFSTPAASPGPTSATAPAATGPAPAAIATPLYPTVGAMDGTRWQLTLDHLCGAYGLPVPPPDTVYRREFLTAAIAANQQRGNRDT